MPTFTPNLHLSKPLVNNATDQDLWGGELNDNFDILDTVIPNIIPSGVILSYAGITEPSGYLFCYGQAISRTTYAALFTAIGTTYGTGDGTTTFNVPDCRGRSASGRDDMGGSAAGRVTSAVSGIDGITLGAVGGDQNLTSHTHGITDPGHQHLPQTGQFVETFPGAGSQSVGGNGFTSNSTTAAAVTNITVNAAGAGGSQNMQPTIIINKIIKT